MRNRPLLRTFLYVDGFNLYYGALKGTPYKWLDPVALATSMFPRNKIIATKFCQASTGGKKDEAVPVFRQRPAFYRHGIRDAQLSKA